MFERVIARFQTAEPGQWVLKGGMALEVRLHDNARLTKDVDLGLRDAVDSASDLHERLVEILTIDLDHDYFVLTVGAPERLRDDSGGYPTWRAKVGARLADKPFGRVQLDVSPRAHELHATDRLAIPNSLAFAGVPAVEVEAVDIHRHAAEKFHGMLRDFGERENSRVRDLVDLVILLEHGLVVPERTATAVRTVWLERDSTEPPDELPPLPESWPDRYRRLAASHDMDFPPYSSAVAHVTQLWLHMFPSS
ncbi:nucleotidyl transferase AbiEii/AbiGii toxin family protein [Umezawaea tangerina]|nr:nucleotidyl transferase AbiEii/AbiGii toxin family protein [Umezawaea tangerina]